MSFRRKRNLHDQWLHFREEKAELFTQTGLDHEVIKTETRFREFLTVGAVQIDNPSGITKLSDLNKAQFRSVMEIIHRYHFDMDEVLFDAYNERRVRFKSL